MPLDDNNLDPSSLVSSSVTALRLPLLSKGVPLFGEAELPLVACWGVALTGNGSFLGVSWILRFTVIKFTTDW
jgi:hypothetical protein